MAANYRRLLGIDRVKDASSLKKGGGCQLAAVADHASAFPKRAAPASGAGPFSLDRRSERPRP
jgi:hypothetical protein